MGRQIQICTTDSDDHLFDHYLRATFDCVLFKSSAPSFEQLEISSFSETNNSPHGAQILIWNREFPWIPQFGQTNTKDSFYILNKSNAPLIEFSKTVWTKQERNGRIYWAKYFTSGPIEYDLVEFEKFYQTITKWFIKNASGKVKYAGINTYYLKEAWERYSKNTYNGS